MFGRFDRAAPFLCAVFMLSLAACGGGGGGGGGDGGGPALIASTTSLTFTSVQNGPTPPPQQVGLSVSGGTVFVGISSVTSSTFSYVFNPTGPTTGALIITPVAPTLLPGTYTGTITIRGCLTDPCASNDVAGSPAVINVSYTIQPPVGFSASPQSFSFSQLQGAAAPAPQTLALSDLSGGNYAWNASITYQSGSGWLNIINGASTASGTSLPASLSLGINSSLTLGTVNAIVRITGNGNAIDVPVSYTVSQAQITPSPAQLTFNAVNGQGVLPPTQNVTLSTQGDVLVAYTASPNYPPGETGWLTALSGTAPGTLTVGVTRTDLSPGPYSATLVLTTATQTISIGVTYVVAASSLTFSPPASFIIDSTFVAAALSQSVSVGATGAPLTWTAASLQPWVTVSPPNGQSGTPVTLSIVPVELDPLDPGTHSTTIIFSYTPPGGSPTSTPLAVSLNLQLPKVKSVTPYVATSGTAKEVILRGLGFNSLPRADVKFGASATVSSYSVVSDTEIRVTHPALTAGPPALRVSIANQLNLVRSTADLVVVDAPAYLAETILYPDAAPKQPLNIIYDAERQELLVGVGLPVAGAPDGSIYRYIFSGSVWSLPATIPESNFRDFALLPDGNRIIATDLTINGFPVQSQIFFSGLALANDGNAIATTALVGSGSTDTYRYSISAGGLTQFPNGFFYFAAAGASADGSRVVLVQGPLSPPPMVFQYTAANGVLSQTALASGANFPRPVLDRSATRVLIGGTTVYDTTNFRPLGRIPGPNNTVALSPDGSRAYAYSSGTLLRTYDLVASVVNEEFQEILPATTLPSDPGLSAVMTVSPDGGTLFIAGDLAIVVVPAPVVVPPP